MIDDNYIINLFYTKKGHINPNKTKQFYKNLLDQNIINYLNNRYNDSESLPETLTRIKNNIDIKPVCPICGKLLKYSGNNKIPYYTYCSDICCNKDPNKKQTAYNTMIKHFGENNKYNRKSAIETYYNKNKEEIQLIKTKRSNTLKNKPLEEKQKIREKCNQTWLNKYGYKEIRQVPEIIQKCIKTKIEKYGTPNNRKKYIETCFKKYGGATHMSNKEICNKIVNSEIRKIHEYETKKKNGTFNTSKPENESYKLLKEKYSDIIYQYKDNKRYPFVCDFYIPSLDLFIECNYHWTHGGHPYNINNKNDQEKLKIMESKNTQYYKNAINCWTVRDPKKREIAKQNNLNYIEFWNINELKEWLKNN